MKIASNYKQNSGFTLVELLVAFVLLSMLFGVLYGGLNLGAKTATAVSRIAVEGQVNAAARDLLRRSIENALFFSVDVESDVFNMRDEASISFEGGSNWLRYVSDTTSPSGRRSPVVFELGVDRADEMLVLKYNHREPAKTAWKKPLVEASAIANNVQSLSIEYLSNEEPELNNWVGEWLDQNTFPSLVRIAVVTGDGPWPTILLHPKNVFDARLSGNDL